MQRMTEETGPAGSVRAWDLPTRLFHWTLVAAIVFAWASWQYSERLGDPSLRLHRWNGHVVLVLIVFRLLWGLAGSSTARWSHVLHWPWRAAGYGLDLLRGRPRLFLGHNPLGSYMVLALLAAVGAQAVMGLFTVEHNDLTAGPLYRLISEDSQQWISGWHRRFFYYGLLALIPIHIAANLFYGLVKKEPLITGMITGTKPAAPYEDAPEAILVERPLLRAFACLVLATAIVFGAIFALGGKML